MPSIRSIIVAAFAATLASAFTTPVGDPSGNPFTFPSAPVVLQAGKPVELTWTPSTTGKVTLVLYEGPATNLVAVGPIAEGIENSGKFTWTPSTDLKSSGDKAAGYGIRLIVDATGQYQWTAAFGVNNPGGSTPSGSGGSSVVSPTNSGSASATGTDYPSGTPIQSSAAPTETDAVSSGYPSGTESAVPTYGSSASESAPATSAAPSTYAPGTTVATSVATTAASPTGSQLPVATNNAASRSVSSGLLAAGVVAGIALML